MKKPLIPIFAVIILGAVAYYFRKLPQNVSLNPELQNILQTKQISNLESEEFVKTYSAECTQKYFDPKIASAIKKMSELPIFAVETKPGSEKISRCFQSLFKADFIKETTDQQNYINFLTGMALNAPTAADRISAVEALAEVKKILKAKWPTKVSDDFKKVLQLKSSDVFSQTMQNELRITHHFIKESPPNDIILYANSLISTEKLPSQNPIRTQNILYSQWKLLIQFSQKCLGDDKSPGCLAESILKAEKEASTNPDYTAIDKSISRKFMAFQVFKKAQKFDDDIKELGL